MDTNKSQEGMEAAFKADFAKIFENQANSVNGMMQPEFLECSYENQTVTISFPVLEWEKNRAGMMHGGIISAAFDVTMGFLSRYVTGQHYAPTICLETVYIRPIPVGDTLIIKSKTNMAGRTVTHLYAEGILGSSEKLAATATGTFISRF